MISKIFSLFLVGLSLAYVLFWGTKDGGNLDFYLKPFLTIWAVFLIAGIIFKNSILSNLSNRWWIALLTLFLIHIVAWALTLLYVPNPIN
jgi:hypothetical protein